MTITRADIKRSLSTLAGAVCFGIVLASCGNAAVDVGKKSETSGTTGLAKDVTHCGQPLFRVQAGQGIQAALRPTFQKIKNDSPVVSTRVPPEYKKGDGPVYSIPVVILSQDCRRGVHVVITGPSSVRTYSTAHSPGDSTALVAIAFAVVQRTQERPRIFVRLATDDTYTSAASVTL